MTDSTTAPFVIAGAGGYACELIAVCRTIGRNPTGVLDDGQPNLDRIAETGTVLLGAVDDAGRWASTFLVGIGYPDPRMVVTNRLLAMGLAPGDAVIHSGAVLIGAVVVSPGTVVFPHVTLSRGARIGGHGLVNYNATVGHDTTVGAFTTIGPGAQIGGECQIGRGVLIGSGAVVLQGLRLGDGSIVGSGAVVTGDVKPGELVVGVPARSR